MACFKLLIFVLFQTAAVFAAEETLTFSRSSYFRTLENKRLKGYVVKRFDSPSLLSCGQQCMRNEWCTSTNYKLSSKKDGKRTCELNKHDISLINENTNFHDQHGVTFSMVLKVTAAVLANFHFNKLKANFGKFHSFITLKCFCHLLPLTRYEFIPKWCL